MKLVEVNTPQTEKEFIQFSVRLYKDDKNYIRPLDEDIKKVFDKNKNKLFRNGDACRWLVQDDSGKTLGRIAAFVNGKTKVQKRPTLLTVGGVGFFDCIDNQEVANMLFDKSKEWLIKRECEAMDGPINFGERNSWWGLLVDGFTEPTYMMNYNLPYYEKLFNGYGFKMYFKQFSYGLPMNSARPEKYIERANNIAKDPDYHFEHIKKDNLEKYAEDFKEIYNKAWAKFLGTKDITQKMALIQLKQMKPVIEEDLMWYGYYKNEPIAFYVNLPEINQYFKHVNGNMNWIGKLKFLYHQKIKKSCRKFFGVIFGVIPEHQGKGIEGAIIMAADKVLRPQNRWDDIELTWIGDFNPKMMRVAESLGCHIAKTHQTMRYIFDSEIEFERYPIMHK